MKRPAGRGVPVGALWAVAELLDELADWEYDPVWPLPLTGRCPPARR